MQDYIEFTINGTDCHASEIASGEHSGNFCWSNDRGEEGKAVPTLLEAQQAAIDWESGRYWRDRYNAEVREANEQYREEQEQYKYGNFL